MRYQNGPLACLDSKGNSKLRLCLDLVRLNKTLIRLLHRGPRSNYILSRLPGIKYLTIINASLGHHDLNLDESLSYLATFSCLFGRYRYIRLPFKVAPMGEMF